MAPRMENVTIPEMMLVTVSKTLTTKASLQTGREFEAVQGKEANQNHKGRGFQTCTVLRSEWKIHVYIQMCSLRCGNIFTRDVHLLHIHLQQSQTAPPHTRIILSCTDS